ncbi:DUF732 domain-containing protein [Mycobacterium tuberculosis]|uniref:DUF732 domain-containing protein n=1 Tax=Mycobacterium tuberculosis TaxID=1773 RepID=UPI003D7C225C
MCRANRGWLVALLPSAATQRSGLAAPGKADPTGDDAAFLATAQLDQAGIAYADPGHAITAAKAMCGPCANGVTRLYGWSRDPRDHNPGADHGQRGRIRRHRIEARLPRNTWNITRLAGAHFPDHRGGARWCGAASEGVAMHPVSPRKPKPLLTCAWLRCRAPSWRSGRTRRHANR